MNFLNAKWQNIIMANYEISPEYLLPFMPKGVELDYYQEKTFVSLVGFLFKNSTIFNVPIPFLGTFEEINLRFYVKRKAGNHIKRGVVFINETVPNKSVAFIANKLYKEHYTCIPTKHKWELTNENKIIEYQWHVNGFWNIIKINASTEKQKMKPGSMEEYIFEHYLIMAFGPTFDLANAYGPCFGNKLYTFGIILIDN